MKESGTHSELWLQLVPAAVAGGAGFFVGALASPLNVSGSVPDLVSMLMPILMTVLLMVLVFSWVRIRNSRRMRHVFTALPVRVGAVDAEGRFHFLLCGDLKGAGGWKKLADCPEEIGNAFAEPIRQVFADGEAREVEYLSGKCCRSARLQRLPGSVFGVETVLWVSIDISELHHTRMRLSELAERFRLTLNSIGDGVIVTDREGRITMVNPAAAQTAAVPEEELFGMHFSRAYQLVRHADGRPAESPVARVLRFGGKSMGMRNDLVTADGRNMRIVESTAPIVNEAGEMLGAVLVFRDLSGEFAKRDRLRIQNALWKQAGELARLVYFRLDENLQLLDGVRNPHFWILSGGQPVPPEEWLVPEDVAAFRGAWVELCSGVSDSITVPYRSVAGGKMCYFEMHAMVLRDGGRKNYIGVIQDTTARREMEADYNNTALLLTNIMDHLPCYIFVKEIDDDFRYVMCNRAFEHVVGRSARDVIHHTDEEIFSDVADIGQFRRDDLQVLEAGKTVDKTEQFTGADGEMFSVRIIKNVIRRADGRKLLLGMGIDISRQERIAVELRRTSSLLNAILDHLPCSFFAKEYAGNGAGRYLIVNNHYCDLVGRTSEELFQKTDLDLYPPEVAEKYIADDQRVMLSDGPFECVELQPTRMGIRQMRTLKTRLHRENEPDLLIGICLDITELQNAYAKIEGNARLFQGLLDNMPALVLVKDIQNNFRHVIWNKVTEAMTGVSAAEALGRDDFELGCFAEASERFRDEDLQLLNGENKMMVYQETLHSVRTGAVHRMRTMKTIIQTDADRSLLLVLSVDVSEEERLKEAQRRLLENQQLINRSLEQVLLEKDFGSAVLSILRTLGGRIGADRGFLFNLTPEGREESFTWECDELVPPARLDAILQESEGFRFVMQQKDIVLIENGVPVLQNSTAWPAGVAELLRERLNMHAVRSAILCGIRRDGVLWGMIGFDFIRSSELFDEGDREILAAGAHLIEIELERQEKQRELQRAEYENGLILDCINVPILLLDPDLRVVRANRAAAVLAENNDGIPVGVPCLGHFCRHGQRPEKCPAAMVLRTGVAQHHSATIMGRDFFISAHPVFDRAGRLINVLENAIDVTDFNEAQRQLTRAMTAAQAADRAKSYFLAMMSHELRTPLNAIIGYSELLQMPETSKAEQEEGLRSILLAGNTLLRLVSDILDLSKLEADKMEFVCAPLNFEKLLTEAAQLFKQSCRTRGNQLNLEMASSLPTLLLDQLRLRQILLNLGGNAVKFTENGVVTLFASFEYAAGDSKHGTLRFGVRDTGIGISPEAQKTLFEPFKQGDSMTRGNRVFEGTGLGLAICRRMVRQMGGTIELTSQLGVGSCFTVILENVECCCDVETHGAVRATLPSPVGNRRKLALLVDDVPMNLRILEAMMKKFHYECISVLSAAEALEEVAEQRPDLVLTDLWMPEMNGIELARHLSQMAHTASIPVVAVTADTQLRIDAGNCLKAILYKPVTVEKLRELLISLEESPV